MPQGNRMSSMQSRGQQSQRRSRAPQAMAEQASEYLQEQIDN